MSYGEDFSGYQARGWSVIPVIGKAPVPQGCTGRAGTVTADKVTGWANSVQWGDANVAIRHDGTIAIDVDAADHDGKAGDEQLAELEARLGQLPATYTSTARGAESASRQHFYRVPEGYRFKGQAADDIEVIHRGHRYSVVWPSAHPETGALYEWYSPEEAPCGVPSLVDLEALPDAWLEFLEDRAEYSPSEDVTDEQLADWLATVGAGEPDGRMRAIAQRTPEGNRGDDNLFGWVGWVVRAAMQGNAGAAEVLRAYLPTWTAVDSGGHSEGAYWRAVRRKLAWYSANPDKVADAPTDAPDSPVEPAAAADPATGFRGRYVDVAALLSGDYVQPVPTIGVREGDLGIFYAGKTNLLFGDRESGKSWALKAVAADVLFDGGNVLWIDLDHNGAADILRHFSGLMGVPQATLADPYRFRLVDGVDSEAEMLGVVEDACEWAPDYVVIDAVGGLVGLFGASSNDSDDYTRIDRLVSQRMANAGCCVVLIDHMAKSAESRTHGAGGTVAKMSTISGVAYRVDKDREFIPGRGGRASLKVHKDRPGGVRANSEGGKNPRYTTFNVDAGDVFHWQFEDGAKANAGAHAPTPLERATIEAEQNGPFTSASNLYNRMRSAGQWVGQEPSKAVYVQWESLHGLTRGFAA